MNPFPGHVDLDIYSTGSSTTIAIIQNNGTVLQGYIYSSEQVFLGPGYTSTGTFTAIAFNSQG